MNLRVFLNVKKLKQRVNKHAFPPSLESKKVANVVKEIGLNASDIVAVVLAGVILINYA